MGSVFGWAPSALDDLTPTQLLAAERYVRDREEAMRDG